MTAQDKMTTQIQAALEALDEIINEMGTTTPDYEIVHRLSNTIRHALQSTKLSRQSIKTAQKARVFDCLVKQIRLNFILNVSEIIEFVDSGEKNFGEFCEKRGYCR